MVMEKSAAPVAVAEATAEGLYKNSNLTKLQMLYWFGQSLRPTVPLFNTVLTFTLSAAVDEDCFREAFQLVASQSDAMRTVIVEVDGTPQRRVLADPPSPLVLVDLSQEAVPQEALRAWQKQRLERPLNMADCLYDSVLVKLGPESYSWFLNQHHLIVDASSVFQVFHSVVNVYSALREGQPTDDLLQLTPFEKYVEFEKAYNASPRFKKSAVYWQKKLAEGIDSLSFYGRVAPKKSNRMQRVAFELDPERTQRLKAATEQKGVLRITKDLALFNVLLTLFFAQLHYMSNSRRLAVMVPFHNRPTDSLKKAIGLLMEISPVMVTIDPDDTFAILLKKVAKELQQALIHYQYGSAVALENNVFDIMFNFHRRPSLTFAGQPVKQELIHPGVGSDRFALHVHDFEETGSFVFYFDFHEDVFSSALRELTVTAFAQLLDAFLDNVETPLHQLNLPAHPAPESSESNGLIHENSPKTAVTHVAPRDELEQTLARIWMDVLDLPTVSVKASFFDLGGSSWLAVRLFNQMQTDIGRHLPLSILFQASTIEDLAQLIRQGQVQDAWTSLVPIRTTGNKPAFFCVHGVTGDVLWLKDLAEYMDADQPFYGIQARGLDGRQAPFDQLEAMAAYYIEQIRFVQPQGPYYLGGYCMGGNIAYEMARQLKAVGEDLPLLVVIDPPPANFSERAPFNGRFVVDFLQNSPRWLREFMRLGGGEISARVRRKGRVAAKAMWQKLRSKAAEEGGMNATDVIDQADDLPEYRQRLIETHLSALMNYVPKGYEGNVIIFEARSRPLLNPGLTSPEWHDYVQTPLVIEPVSGSHSSMLQPPNVISLARDLQSRLDAAFENSE